MYSKQSLFRQLLVVIRGIRNPGVRQCLGFCTADFWSSLAYESAVQKPKHCLTPGFLIPLVVMTKSVGWTLQDQGWEV